MIGLAAALRSMASFQLLSKLLASQTTNRYGGELGTFKWKALNGRSHLLRRELRLFAWPFETVRG
jgi:hypothetical protein